MNKFNDSVKQNKKLVLIVASIFASITLCVALNCIAGVSSQTAYGDPQAEVNALNQQIAAKTAELEDQQNEYGDAMNQLQTAENNIKEQKNAINDATNKINKSTDVIKTDMVADFKHNTSTDLLRMFLEADSFQQIIKNWEFVELLTSKRANQVAECKHERARLEEATESLQASYDDAKANEERARNAKNSAESVIAGLVHQRDSLSAEAKAIQARQQQQQQQQQQGGGGGGVHPTPGPSPTPGPTPSPGGNAVAQRALSQIGKPYAWGAAGPNAYDCSGLCSYALTGRFVHCYTAASFLSWSRVSDPAPGDICTSGGHCGVYVGNGSMCHAPTFGQTVCVAGVQGGMIIVRG